MQTGHVDPDRVFTFNLDFWLADFDPSFLKPNTIAAQAGGKMSGIAGQVSHR